MSFGLWPLAYGLWLAYGLLLQLLPDPLVMLDRRARREILELEHLADFHFAFLERRTLHPLDGLGLRLRLNQPEPADQFLGLGERPVDDGRFAAVELHARALRRRLKPLAGKHHARFHHFFVELGHLAEDVLVGHDAGFGFLVGLHNQHESHGGLSPLTIRRMERAEIDTRLGEPTPTSLRLNLGGYLPQCGLKAGRPPSWAISNNWS